MKRRVIYHANCPDGFCAAWVAQRYFRTEGVEEDTTFEPWQYGAPPPEVDGDTALYILDFSFPRDVMESLLARCAFLLCLDHHKTAQENLEGLRGCVFDMDRSGASLTWNYFFPSPRPWLVDYVEDRDLWRWALPRSREVSAWVMAQPHDFRVWDALVADGPDKAAERGAAIRVHIDNYCRAVAKQSYLARLGGTGGAVMPCVNAPMVNVSDVLQELLKTADVACAWFRRADGRYQHSLRSRGDVDVSDIARTFGGGGHRNAAGFESADCQAAPLREEEELRR